MTPEPAAATDAIRARLCRVMAQVLDVPESSLGPQSSPDDIPSWDSMAHVLLVVEIEREFQVAIPVEQTLEMVNIRSIVSILQELGAEPSARGG